jgi:hypothetical protein
MVAIQNFFQVAYAKLYSALVKFTSPAMAYASGASAEGDPTQKMTTIIEHILQVITPVFRIAGVGFIIFGAIRLFMCLHQENSPDAMTKAFIYLGIGLLMMFALPPLLTWLIRQVFA